MNDHGKLVSLVVRVGNDDGPITEDTLVQLTSLNSRLVHKHSF